MSVKTTNKEKKETVLQRSRRHTATQRYNLSAVRIDLNALDLQRREAGNLMAEDGDLYGPDEMGLHLWEHLSNAHAY